MSSRLIHITLFLSISTLAVTQVWLSHLRIEASQLTSILQQKIDSEQREIQALGLEYASLSRPNRLRRLAHRELGMRAPHPMQVLQP